jgi:predicted nicotinamide N-methyase
MIRHIVMFKMKAHLSGASKQEALLRLKEAVDGMEQHVSQVKFLQTGININNRPQAFDLVLLSDFETEEDLDLYRDHPQHQKVMDVIGEVVETVHVVDYHV